MIPETRGTIIKEENEVAAVAVPELDMQRALDGVLALAAPACQSALTEIRADRTESSGECIKSSNDVYCRVEWTRYDRKGNVVKFGMCQGYRDKGVLKDCIFNAK